MADHIGYSKISVFHFKRHNAGILKGQTSMIHVSLFNISLLRSVSESLIHLTKSQLITGKFFCPLYITSTRPTIRQTAIENTLEKTAEPALQ